MTGVKYYLTSFRLSAAKAKLVYALMLNQETNLIWQWLG